MRFTVNQWMVVVAIGAPSRVALSGQTVLFPENYGSVVNKQPGSDLRNLKRASACVLAPLPTIFGGVQI